MTRPLHPTSRSIATTACRFVRAIKTFHDPQRGLFVPASVPVVDMARHTEMVERYRDAAVIWPTEHADGLDDKHIRRFLIQAGALGLRGDA